MTCHHTRTISVYTETTGEEFSRRCSGCGKQMSLGPATPVDAGTDAARDYFAAWLIAEFTTGQQRMTHAEVSGFGGDANSPFAGNGAWYAGWLVRAWVDHEELQAQRESGLVSDLVDDLESAGGTQQYPGGPCASASPVPEDEMSGEEFVAAMWKKLTGKPAPTMTRADHETAFDQLVEGEQDPGDPDSTP